MTEDRDPENEMSNHEPRLWSKRRIESRPANEKKKKTRNLGHSNKQSAGSKDDFFFPSFLDASRREGSKGEAP